MIISRMLPGARFVLYYNVSDDVYAWNDPQGGTLFKRRQAAALIHRKLADSPRRKAPKISITLTP